jgi:hypothetical protein
VILDGGDVPFANIVSFTGAVTTVDARMFEKNVFEGGFILI